MSAVRAQQDTEPSGESRGPDAFSTRAALAWAAAIAAPTVYLSFNAGGFFPFAPALVAVLVLLALVLRITTVERPFAGIGTPAAVAIAGLALFALWTLVSGFWSDAWGRSLVEFDRALLYVAVLTFFAAAPWRRERLRALLAGLTVAIVGVAAIALVTRVLPEVWPLAPNVNDDRLSYPLTYWNALGLLVCAGLLGALHFSAHGREPAWARVAASAALPLLAATLYFTLSRGSMGVAVLGALLYLAIARPRGALPAIAAALPSIAIVVYAGYQADALTSATPTSARAVDQGHTVALVVLGAIVLAAVLRAALLRFDARMRAPAWRLPVRPWVAVTGAAALVVVALLVSGLPQRAIDDFGNTGAISNLDDQRSRLLSASNNGRFEHWRVAIDSFEAHPLLGTGAGTYQLEWAQHRPSSFTVINAHSLYAQVLGELGVVGLLLLLAALGAIVVGLARRARGEDRAVVAAVIAILAAWAVHAGIDWDWEMPAVTWWVFALGGAGIAGAGASATSVAQQPSWLQRRTPRLVLGLCCLLLAVTPALLGLSQLRLDRASDAFDRGDCETAIDESLAAISVLGTRPQPYALVGLCDVRLGADQLGVQMLERAVARDPDDWEYHYGLALAQAAAGQDPRAEARRAKQLNPLDPRTAYGLTLYGNGDPRQWRRRALAAPLPF